MSDLPERIREAADEVGGLNKLAYGIEVPRRTLGYWLKGKQPKPAALEAISKFAGVSLHWLMTGDGEKKPKSKADEAESAQPHQSFFAEPRPPATVKYYPVYASAGFGATALYESPGEDLDIDGFFNRAFDVRAKHVNLFPIKGDSMLPTLAHGDIAIIDRRVTGDPEVGAVYLVSVNGDIYVKRTEWQQDGSLLLVSDNQLPEYATIEVMKDDLDKLTVLGQVIGVVHTL